MQKSEIIKIVTKVQVVAWLIFIISDLIQEMIKKSDIYFWIPILFVCIIPIWYLKEETQICNKINIAKIKFLGLSIAIWIIETAIVSSCLWYALTEHLWIKQNSIQGLWNGIEYIVFPFFLAITPILIIIIIKVIKFLYVQLRMMCNRKR